MQGKTGDENGGERPETEQGAGTAPESAIEGVESPWSGAPASAAAPAGQESEAGPEDQIAELNDRLLRAMAETENLRRRAAKEREDAAKYGVSNFARDMLSVADNLRRALDSLPKDADAESPIATVIEGLELTERELLSALERHGIRRVDPMGEKFSHDLHEAMFEVPTDEQPPGTVVQVMEPGYVIHDRLLRPARVGVAKASDGGAGAAKVDTTA